jgi:DNA polymerase-3 subunit gamma/tau
MDNGPLAGGAGTAAPAEAASAYRVLARKYRPKSFADLVGHGPMVQTLSNAFETGRIAQAWMLTGVRGVGKTTTARILARALNYEIAGRVDKPTVEMSELGAHCQAIMEGRHVDVIEMDAASHTGVDDVREIIEAVRYKPATARFKVYIIDEVHMLSGAAFNALLKTLEEPPEHAKFIFATTEIRKVPITILSRCQRFDLRRIDAGLIEATLRRIAEAEGVAAEPAALAAIARAAEGSMRDAQTLLDQAIAHGAGAVEAETVRRMLGLADRTRIIDLFEMLMRGEIAGALGELRAQYDLGAEPQAVLSDLAAFTHFVTRVKLVPATADDAGLIEAERERGQDFAGSLSIRVLSRAWQVLLKGIEEVQASTKPLAAADMVLVRLAYAADLPTPDEALRQLRDSNGAAAPAGPARPSVPTDSVPRARLVAGGGTRAAPGPAVAAPAPATVALSSLDEMIALAETRRDPKMKFDLERHVRPIVVEPGRIEFEPGERAPANLAGEIGRKFSDWTGMRWIATVARAGGGETAFEREQSQKSREMDEIRANPTVAAVLNRFPGAEIVNVGAPGGSDIDVPLAEPGYEDMMQDPEFDPESDPDFGHDDDF